MLGDTDEEGKHPGKFSRSLAFFGQMKRRGMVACSLCSGHVVDERRAYSDSFDFSEQLIYKNYFHLSYGLFYMIYQTF